jgi:hypothetical protein
MNNNRLLIFLAAFCVASLIHFIHNAEFLAQYPGMPKTWTRGGVYGAWALMTAIGFIGYAMTRTKHLLLGLVLIAAYALCGLDSLGHYIVAPMGAHNIAMNATIFLEVTCAFVLFVYTAKLFLRVARRQRVA